MAEGRGVDAFRVRALLRLFELLGVAEEDDAARRVGGREDVGEGHLGGLVDEQHVDGLRELFARPQPGRAAHHAGGAILKRFERLGIVGELGDAWVRSLHLIVVSLVGDGDFVVRGQVEDRFEEVQHHLVAGGHDADLLPLLHEVADDGGAGERLARAGRALDREDAVFHVADGADRELNRGLGGEGFERARLELRGFGEEEACRDGVREQILGDPVDGLLHHAGVSIGVREQPLGVVLALPLTLADVDGSAFAIDRDHGPERFAVAGLELVLGADFHLLVRVLVAMDHVTRWLARLGAHDDSDVLDELQAGEGLAFLDEVLLRHVPQPEVFPCRSLPFAGVPVEHVREEPAGLLLRASIGALGGDTREQFGAAGLDAFRLL